MRAVAAASAGVVRPLTVLHDLRTPAHALMADPVASRPLRSRDHLNGFPSGSWPRVLTRGARTPSGVWGVCEHPRSKEVRGRSKGRWKGVRRLARRAAYTLVVAVAHCFCSSAGGGYSA